MLLLHSVLTYENTALTTLSLDWHFRATLATMTRNTLALHIKMHE